MKIFIILLVVFIIGKFIYNRNQQAAKVTMEGGMRNKYRTLIEIFMAGDSRKRIFHETAHSISFGLSSIGGTTVFTLTQTFGSVNVQWKLDSPVFGKHKMEWDFPEYGDQEKMAERIANDTGQYQQNFIKAMGQPNPGQ